MKIDSIHIFIISWKGQHENALYIASKLQDHFQKLTIVFSDPNENLHLGNKIDQIKRPNNLLWPDKFEACLNACQSDFLLIIHADCKCEDWLGLSKRCYEVISSNKSIGVWAPKIEGTPYHVTYTRIARMEGTSLSIVAQTDAIIFALSLPILDRMRRANYKKNIYGWGIDWIFCCWAFVLNKLVIVDESVSVFHPITRGYEDSTAFKEQMDFLGELSIEEKVQFTLLNTYVLYRTKMQS